VTTNDEVGELARAFNRMTAELAETDRLRRDLVANVSHELRTPIGALQAVLENVVDGVSEPDPETLATMLAQTRRLGRRWQERCGASSPSIAAAATLEDRRCEARS